MTQHEHDNIPADLEGVADALDALARVDRDAAPADLASRLARAGAEAEPPSVIARIGGGGPLRIAAAVAVAAIGVTGAVLMTQGNSASDGIDIDALAAEGAETLRVAYASDAAGLQGEDNSLWGLGGSAASERSAEGASLWDLGSDAFDDDLDWAALEEVL